MKIILTIITTSIVHNDNYNSDLYEEHGFDVIPVLSGIKDLTTPSTSEKRGRRIAEQVIELNQPTVVHMISGSVWTSDTTTFGT